MNSELHTLFWYTRAELVSTRRKIIPFPERRHETVTELDDIRSEVDDIISAIVQTLDDIMETQLLLWNTLFLSHIIHSLSVHLSNLSDVHNAAVSRGVSMLTLDINYIRLECFIKTLLNICQANIITLCTNSSKTVMSKSDLAANRSPSVKISTGFQRKEAIPISPTWTTKNKPHTNPFFDQTTVEPPPSIKSGYLNHSVLQYNRDLKRSVSTSSGTQNFERERGGSMIDPIFGNQLGNDTTTPKSTGGTPTGGTPTGGTPTGGIVTGVMPKSRRDSLHHAWHSKSFTQLLVNKKIDQLDRLSVNLTSKDMVQAHTRTKEAVSVSAIDKGLRISVDYTNTNTNQKKTNDMDTSKHHAVMRWRAAHQVIRTMVKIPKRTYSTNVKIPA